MTPHSLHKDNQLIEPLFPFQSLHEALNTWEHLHKDKPAIIFDDFDHHHSITLTYQDINHHSQAISQTLLHTYKLKANDHISFAFTNSPEIILLNYAAWRSGLITVPLDTTRDTTERKIYKLKLTNAKILFTRNTPEVLKENKAILKQLPKITIIPIADYDSCISALTKTKEEQSTAPPLNNDCLILFTSGTTADPKGVQLTPASLFANATSIQDWLQINHQDRFHIVLPLHHINSTTFVNTTLLAGGTVILSPRYSKTRFWKTMAAHQATISSIVPTIAYDLLSETKQFNKYQDQLQQVSRIQLGSAPVQPKVVKQFYFQHGIRLVQGYGQTETSLRSTGVPLSLSEPAYLEMVTSNSIGTELKYSNVAVLTKEGREAHEGEEGDVCVRGPLIMKGYLNNPKATKEAFEFDWFHSGDTGYWQQQDGHKFFYLKGRTKEIIKKGGVLISPLSIENSLLDSFSELNQVYIVGYPHPRYGQDVGAIIVSKTQSSSRYWIDKINHPSYSKIAAFEKPQSIMVMTAKDLPQTSTGKIQRTKMSQLFGETLRTQSLTIAKTKQHIFRIIESNEDHLLNQAATISQKAWGKHLAATSNHMQQRCQNGLVIGAIDNQGNLKGLINGMTINKSELAQSGEPGHWTSTWDSLTDQGTLATNNPKGDALICIDISVDNSNPTEKPLTRKKQLLTKQAITTYINSSKDYVIRFHQKAKGGYKEGASVTQINLNSRVNDQDSLGINVLMQYPTITTKPNITSKASLGQQLIESVMIWAYQHNLETIAVYTRPAQASQYFESSSANT